MLTEHQKLPSIDLYNQRAESTVDILSPARDGERAAFHEAIASAELQNPSDALEILAQVADRAEEGDLGGDRQGNNASSNHRFNSRSQTTIDNVIHYKPIQRGQISPDDIYQLFSR